MPALRDFTGIRQGKLKVLHKAPSVAKRVYWLVQCACGVQKLMRGESLQRNAQSCGCGRIDSISSHKMTHTAEYKTWWGMKYRCSAKAGKYFENYGKRGITVCKRWQNSFLNFLNDMGPRPSPKHSIDRIDNDKGYSPANCRWATASQQNFNRRLPKQWT